MPRFDGKKDPARARSAVDGTLWLDSVTPFRPYRKKTYAYAVQMTEPFEVDTLEGLHSGKGLDYLAVGAHGEMYPIDREVFESTYEAAD